MSLADVSGIRERHLGAALDAFCFCHLMSLNIAQPREMSNENKIFDKHGVAVYSSAMMTLKRIGEWLFNICVIWPIVIVLTILWKREKIKDIDDHD